MKRQSITDVTVERGEVKEIRCSRCDDWKPAAEFKKDKRRASGCSSWCIACTRGYMREYRERAFSFRRTLYFTSTIGSRIETVATAVGVRPNAWMRNAILAALDAVEATGSTTRPGVHDERATRRVERVQPDAAKEIVAYGDREAIERLSAQLRAVEQAAAPAAGGKARAKVRRKPV